MATALAKHGLRLDVPVSYAEVGSCKGYPFLDVASWIETLDKTSKLDRLLGEGGATSFSSTLKSFWAKYQLSHPSHQMFSSGLKPEDCIPVYLHGDEGTTYKKDGALCISFQSPLGRGTSTTKLGQLDGLDDTIRQKLNYLGHAFETRFLIIAGLKDSLSRTMYSLAWGYFSLSLKPFELENPINSTSIVFLWIG